MTGTACPYCYRRFRAANLHFQCSGRPAPGRDRCAKTTSADRRRLTGFTAAALPTFPPAKRNLRRTAECPGCGTSTGIRACPACRTPLPANFGSGRSPLIGMVGGKNAGKTVYTTVLVHELMHRVRGRFEADVAFAGEQAGASTSGWLENYERALFDSSTLFEATAAAAGGVRVPVVLQWRQPRRVLGRERHATTTLSFYDAAGEDLTSQESVNGQAYLGAASGLIVLLDPFQLPGVRDRIAVPDVGARQAEPPLSVLNRITQLLRTTGGVTDRRRIPVPVAVVFSKIDAFFEVLGGHHPLLREPAVGPHYDEAVGRDTDEHVRSLLADLGADDLDAHLRAHYARYRFFAVSSLGAEPDYGRRVIDPGGVRPFRVDEPLLWLLNRFKVVPRRGR